MPNIRWDGFNLSACLGHRILVIWEIGYNSTHTAIVFWMKLQLQFNSVGLLQSSLSRWIDLMNQNLIVLTILKKNRKNVLGIRDCNLRKLLKQGRNCICLYSFPTVVIISADFMISLWEGVTESYNTLFSKCHFVGMEPVFIREP